MKAQTFTVLHNPTCRELVPDTVQGYLVPGATAYFVHRPIEEWGKGWKLSHISGCSVLTRPTRAAAIAAGQACAAAYDKPAVPEGPDLDALRTVWHTLQHGGA